MCNTSIVRISKVDHCEVWQIYSSSFHLHGLLRHVYIYMYTVHAHVHTYNYISLIKEKDKLHDHGALLVTCMQRFQNAWATTKSKHLFLCTQLHSALSDTVYKLHITRHFFSICNGSFCNCMLTCSCWWLFILNNKNVPCTQQDTNEHQVDGYQKYLAH